MAHGIHKSRKFSDALFQNLKDSDISSWLSRDEHEHHWYAQNEIIGIRLR